MFEHFKGEEVFVKKVLDYLDQVQYKQRLILTQFLDPYHQSIVKSVIGHQDEGQVLENGGFIHSESQRIIIAPYFYEIEKEDFEIVVCKIIYAKNFEKLTHRDILGALMSLAFPIGKENGHTAPNSPSWLSCRLPRPRVWALLYGGGND